MPLKETLKKHFLLRLNPILAGREVFWTNSYAVPLIFFCCNIQGFKLNNKKICEICKHTQGEKKGGGQGCYRHQHFQNRDHKNE